MSTDNENISYLVERGISLEEIQRYIKQGISLEELREAVESLEARGDRRFGGPAPLDSVKPPDYSDAGNASIFKRAYQNDLIFVDALAWLYWNGRQWNLGVTLLNDCRCLSLFSFVPLLCLKRTTPAIPHLTQLHLTSPDPALPAVSDLWCCSLLT